MSTGPPQKFDVWILVEFTFLVGILGIVLSFSPQYTNEFRKVTFGLGCVLVGVYALAALLKRDAPDPYDGRRETVWGFREFRTGGAEDQLGINKARLEQDVHNQAVPEEVRRS